LVVKINTINPQPLKKGGMEQVILWRLIPVHLQLTV
jgi:hypothetical protein